LGLSSVPWRFCTLLCERWVNDWAYSWRPLPASAADVRKVWEIVNHFPILLIDMLFQAHAEKSQGKARQGMAMRRLGKVGPTREDTRVLGGEVP
jgi:hypothetical protein